MLIRDKEFDFKNNAYMMGILNVTPNSFSDKGKWNDVDRAVKHTGEMTKGGASIVDIGAESTRLGYTPLSTGEELERVVPTIRRIREDFDVPISLNTYKADTLRGIVKEGADILNDIWGLRSDPKMAQTAKELDIPVTLMHNKNNDHYNDLVKDLNRETLESIELIEKVGIREDLVILDPGVGFTLDYEGDLLIMNRVKEFIDLGCPISFGTSRKRFIRRAMEIGVATDRDFGTAITTAIDVMNGCSVFRVHNVKQSYGTMRMALVIKREGK